MRRLLLALPFALLPLASDIEAHYAFTCSTPDALKALDLAQFFKTFPGTHKFKVQLIGPSGQQAVEVTAKAPVLKF